MIDAVKNVSGRAKIRCQAERGMFSYELGLLIKGVDRFYETMIDADQVEVDEVPSEKSRVNGRIAADMIQINGEKMLVELPRQVVAGGRRIWVPLSEVESHEPFVEAVDS